MKKSFLVMFILSFAILAGVYIYVVSLDDGSKVINEETKEEDKSLYKIVNNIDITHADILPWSMFDKYNVETDKIINTISNYKNNLLLAKESENISGIIPLNKDAFKYKNIIFFDIELLFTKEYTEENLQIIEYYLEPELINKLCVYNSKEGTDECLTKKYENIDTYRFTYLYNTKESIYNIYSVHNTKLNKIKNLKNYDDTNILDETNFYTEEINYKLYDSIKSQADIFNTFKFLSSKYTPSNHENNNIELNKLSNKELLKTVLELSRSNNLNKDNNNYKLLVSDFKNELTKYLGPDFIYTIEDFNTTTHNCKLDSKKTEYNCTFNQALYDNEKKNFVKGFSLNETGFYKPIINPYSITIEEGKIKMKYYSYYIDQVENSNTKGIIYKYYLDKDKETLLHTAEDINNFNESRFQVKLNKYNMVFEKASDDNYYITSLIWTKAK